MRLAMLLVVLAAGPALAKEPDCPAAVRSGVDKAYPKAKVESCKPEDKQFEVKLTTAAGAALELDVTSDGTIVQIEEPIALDKLPAAVTKAFGRKYPKVKATRAEKQTHVADGKISYELAFELDGKNREATFGDDGHFIEEE